MNVVSLLQAAAAGGGLFAMIAPFALIFVIFYFFIIRPQNKKQKETKNMIAALKKGDKIVTIGGIHGVISSAKEQTVIVKVDDNAKMEFSRSAISSVTDNTANKPAAKKEIEAEKPVRKSRGKKITETTDSEETPAEETPSDENTK